MQGDVIRRRVVIHGRVQGVFFRDSLRRQARANGVSGWARNRPDGTVEAVLEGAEDRVQRILQFSRTGPRHARVDRVDASEEAPEGLAGFEIR
jgi:acylphosphatase